MKKNFRLFLLLTMIIAVSASAFRIFPSNAEVTWVEGHISQDTLWTLTDSPYVVVGNVTIDRTATLTIEPEVEILFGGEFNILVYGKIVANGNQNQMIRFSSNKKEPSSGDWIGIIFNGSEPSTLRYCTIEYATNGTTINNSSVEIRNSEIRNCSQNGIVIIDSNVTVESNTITGNIQNGILISGNGQVNVTNNEFKMNENGILLTGDNVSNVNIRNNKILQSRQKGIHLGANEYTNIEVSNNIVSSNYHGVYISGEKSPYITNNSIAYNTFGLYYENIQYNHTVCFNDIYGNDMGIDVSVSENVTSHYVYVNATYNYWGDRSGPYHESMNPEGKGNPVGGDGENLDFIPFLTANISYINERPNAVLIVDKSLAAPNQTVTFIATLSNDDGRVDYYFFDFGDGQTSGFTTLSVVVHNYSTVGEFTAKLMVIDDFGVRSVNASKTISVQDLTPLEVSLIPEKQVVDYGENVSITVKVTVGGNPVEEATVKLLAVRGGSFLSDSGTTNSMGYFTTVFTAPEVTHLTSEMIVVNASKEGYAVGADYKYIRVIPPLVIDVSAEPSKVKSEETAEINVFVTYDGDPMANVSVSIVANNGSFVTQTENTDSNGECIFVFNAPLTITLCEVVMNLTATKEGYLPGWKQLTLTVEPKTLAVNISLNPSTVQSEEKVNVEVYVTYEGEPIENATVNISSSAGNLSKTTGLTDSAGYLTSIFTAPQVNEETNITISAVAEKTGYAPRGKNVTVIVTLGILEVEVEVNPSVIGPEGSATVTVNVTRKGVGVSGVNIAVSSDSGGLFSPVSGVTNENGTASFTFVAPHVDKEMNVTVTVVASKNGYLNAEAQVFLTVSPEVAPSPAFGLPWWFIAVLVVIAVVVVFVVLVKLKIIVISWKET